MDKFLINGPCKIKGKVFISGSKNASLPILAATLLFDKPVIIKNLPRVRDINTMLNLLKSLGSKIILSNDRKTAKIINKKNMRTFASYSHVKTMRGSILVLGPLISKFNKAKISLPGGCLIGARPVNYHLAALKKLGMGYKIKDGYILAKSNGRLKGQTIKFPKISVGATENSIIAACLAKGKKTKLINCACEPEIKDLTQFLNKAGAKIKWSGRTCTIEGVNYLVPTTHAVMADRIEAGTFCVAATLTKGNLEIKNFDPKIIHTELKLLKKVGAKIKTNDDTIFIKGPDKLRSVKNIKTKEFPGIPTDLQAQLMVLMCRSNGNSTITESIFENRFMHVAELQRLGAKINIKNNKAFIEGNTKFIGAQLMSSDLRASVALVLAALVANGKSIVGRVYHLERGYENIVNKLKKIGVKIRRLK
ncbi:UDP-N-acetylglucosamine 1-carboxyvinyltransferase [Candidatus Pelagibacter sp.]|nr:UDP-N-acetylglucosamine 1-carboxyvinyltransferase [Candidatus Pelagibacter sp.]